MSQFIFKKPEKKGFEILYPKRKISSIYFDNTELNMFVDSEEGSIPEKKSNQKLSIIF